MRAVVLDDEGQPRLAEVPEPDGDGMLVRVRACGLCGSDVEKLGRAAAGTVLGHEVVGELDGGERVALVHHLPCGQCERCRAGHESTCDRFREPTIVPGGFAEWVRAQDAVALPVDVDDAWGTLVEPLACVLRGVERVPRGSVVVVGLGFVGQLFARVLRRRGDDVYGVDPRAERVALAGVNAPSSPEAAAIVCAPGAGAAATAHVEAGGTVVVFAPGGVLGLDDVYRRELHVVGSRSATPVSMREAAALLPQLEPLPLDVLPLERFDEGLARYRSGRSLKVVFTP